MSAQRLRAYLWRPLCTAVIDTFFLWSPQNLATTSIELEEPLFLPKTQRGAPSGSATGYAVAHSVWAALCRERTLAQLSSGGRGVLKCRRTLAAYDCRCLMDELVIFEGCYHEERKVYAARDITLEDGIAHMATPDR